MTAQEFLKYYEKTTNSHDFDAVAPMVAGDAVYWFSDGTFEGIDNIRRAFVATWDKIQNEVYHIKNVRWLVAKDDTAICIYDFSWHGILSGVPQSGQGRGTNIMIKTNGQWQMVHEHLSKIP